MVLMEWLVARPSEAIVWAVWLALISFIGMGFIRNGGRFEEDFTKQNTPSSSDDVPQDNGYRDAISRSTNVGKKVQRCPTDDLICPITLELPVEPVTAEDGWVYEKAAIETYFAAADSDTIRSCHTNLVMGRRLLPAPHIKSLIETLIENATITGDLADRWKQRTKGKRNEEELIQNAKDGSVDAMVDIALNYYKGTGGLERDESKAFSWFERAHNNGSAVGTVTMGLMLANGDGVPRNERRGAMFLCIAAGMGSDLATCLLGEALANGDLGFSVNDFEAIRWLQRSLSENCPLKHMNVDTKMLAREKLNEVETRQG